MSKIEFLLTIFPEAETSLLATMLESNDIEEIVAELLSEKSQDEDDEWQDMLFLKSIFPNIDESTLHSHYCQDGMDQTIKKILNLTNITPKTRAKILLPKNLTSKIEPQNQDNINMLCDMFPMYDEHTVHAVLTKEGGNVDSVAQILSSYNSLGEPKEQIDGDIIMLMELFPSQSKAELILKLRKFGSVQNCVDNLYKDDNSRSAWDSPLLERRGKDLIHFYTPPNQSSHLNSLQHLKSNQAYSKGGSKLDFKSKIIVDDSIKILKDPDLLRQSASNLLSKRNECYREAAKRFTKNNLTGRGSASYYSEKGHELNREMKVLNEEAANLLFVSKNIDENVIDLHGLTVKEAEVRLLDYCDSWCAKKFRPKVLKIITGAGNHSSGRGKLYESMSRLMIRKSWSVEVGGNGWFFARP